MNKAQQRLRELLDEYGEERVVTWCETRLKHLQRTQDPVYREEQSRRVREKRAAERRELMELRQQLKATG